MFTTADLPTALRFDPTAPHVCGRVDCTGDPASVPEAHTGVPSNV